MEVWVLPKCIRKCDIVFRGVWVEGWRGEGVVSFRSPGPCIATLLRQLTPLARGHSSAGPVQPAPIGVRWGLSWCLTHCWTSPLSSYGLTPPSRSRRTVNPKHSKVNSDTDGHWCTHKYQQKLKMWFQPFFAGKPHTLLHHREHGYTTLHLLWALGWHPGCYLWKFLHINLQIFWSACSTRLCEGFFPQVGLCFFFSTIDGSKWNGNA